MSGSHSSGSFRHVSYRWDETVAAKMDPVAALIYRSNQLGSDQRITNTGGGNTSAKIREKDPLTGESLEVLWVKGSGGDLRTATKANFASLVLGLAAGLGLGLAVWFMDRRDEPPPAAAEETPPAPMSMRGSGVQPEAAERYDFYDMLPKFEVVVPEKEKPVRPDRAPVAAGKPGPYVLQAGSYRDFAEADRIRAQLALQGIESRVQKVSVDADTWHRVRIGPISDPAELERIRQRLREADIDVLVIRLPE